MRREIRKYLFDIDQACRLLEQFTAGKDLTDYLADAMLRSAVERPTSRPATSLPADWN
jgi:uncharacterized protein with HEPN domain